MRVLAILLLALAPLPAQFKSTVPLVIAPTTITDDKGRPVDGLTARDVVLYDNNVPQTIQVDTEINPISLVVLIETAFGSSAVVDKLGGSGVLFTDMLSAEAGETEVLSFSDGVRVAQEFTTDGARVSHAVRSLRVEGNGVSLYEGLLQALRTMATRDPSRRRVMLVIAERRARSLGHRSFGPRHAVGQCRNADRRRYRRCACARNVLKTWAGRAVRPFSSS